MEEHLIPCKVGEPSSYMLSFTNPFNQPMNVDVVLIENTNEHQQTLGQTDERDNQLLAGGVHSLDRRSAGRESVFTLLLKRRNTGLRVPPLGALQIPVSFSPWVIAESSAAIEVRGSHKSHSLTWVYPIKGVVHAPLHPKAFPIRCKAKSIHQSVVDLPLKSIVIDEAQSFGHELVFPPGLDKAVAEQLRVTPVKNSISSPDELVRYQITFEPMKPFSTQVKLVVIQKSTGGRWPFDLQLDALEADPDDTIYVKANPKTVSSVSFRLNNRTAEYATFTAYFAGDSVPSLTVQPLSGLLPPVTAAEGTVLTVNFAPLEYGKRERGRLIVETDSVRWTYNVIGSHPIKTAPKNVTAKVMSKKRTSNKERPRRAGPMSR